MKSHPSLVFCLLLAALPCLGENAAPEPPGTTDKPAGTAPAAPAEVKMQPNGDIILGEITLHRTENRLSFPANVELDSGPLEMLIATPEGRIHETLLVTHVKALHLQTLLYLLGIGDGPRIPDDKGRQGQLVDIDIEWTDTDGKKKTEPVERWVANTGTGKEMVRRGWVFTGSKVVGDQLQADIEGNLVLVYSVGQTVLDIPDSEGEDDTIFEVNPERRNRPGRGKTVRVVVTPRSTRPAPPPTAE